MNTLVAGIGNIFCGDDAFGVAVIHRLRSRPLPSQVRLLDAGIRARELLYTLLEGWARVILVDAAALGKPPGTVSLLELDTKVVAPSTMDAHSLRTEQVLASAASMGATLGRVVLLGCEPATFEPGSGPEPWSLSPVVTAAIDPAVGMIERLLEPQEQVHA